MIDNITLDEGFAHGSEALYQRLRSEAPVCTVEFVDGARGWLITRYDDAVALLKDPRVNIDRERAFAHCPAERPRSYSGPLRGHMLRVDPPAHARLRQLVVQAFTPLAVARLHPVIEAIVGELLDDLALEAADGPVDLVADYAELLPVQVIGEFLGLPLTYARPLQAAVRRMVSNATLDEKALAEQQVVEMLDELIEHKSRQPGEDLLSGLIGASVDGRGPAHDELLAICVQLITAGYETTANFIGNGMLALLDNPLQLQKIRAEPKLLGTTVEEILRFDGPVHVATMRFTTDAVEVDGVIIPPNQPVLISLLSANRDPARFPDPDQFDVERNTRGHIAFGHGIHHCLGASLARMEGRTAIGRLIERFDNITPARTEERRHQKAQLTHGSTSLPVWLSHGVGTSTTD